MVRVERSQCVIRTMRIAGENQRFTKVNAAGENLRILQNR